MCVCGAKEGREREGGVIGSGCAWAPCCYPASQQAGHAFPGLRDFCCSTLHGITSPSQRAPSTPQTPTASCTCAQRHHRRLYFTNTQHASARVQHTLHKSNHECARSNKKNKRLHVYATAKARIYTSQPHTHRHHPFT